MNCSGIRTCGMYHHLHSWYTCDCLVYRVHNYVISIGNHMNSSAIWEIIALSHVLEGRVITRGEAEWNLSF